MATIGSIVIDLKANSAQFHAEIGRARQSVQTAGHTFELTKRQATGFAREGLGEIARVSPQLVGLFGDLAQKSRAAGIALQAIGFAALVRDSFEFGRSIGEQIRVWVRYGESLAAVEARIEALNKGTEANRKFLESRGRAVSLAATIDRQSLEARSAIAQLAQKAIGDEIAAEEEGLTTRLRLLDLERAARQREIFERVAMGETRNALLARSDGLFLVERQKALLAHNAEVGKLQDANRDRQITVWKDETEKLVGQLKARLEVRRAIEASLPAAATALGLTTSVSQGLAKIKEIEQTARTVAAGIALQERTGAAAARDLIQDQLDATAAIQDNFAKLRTEFGHVPAVMDALNAAMARLQFGDFFNLVAQGGDRLRALGIEFVDLRGAVDAIGSRLGRDLPANIQAAIPQIQNLRDWVANLKAWLDATAQSTRNLNTELGGP